MKITAILAIRNEEVYLANCLRHLAGNEIDFVIIDNGSSDGSAGICRRREFARNLVDVQWLPFGGSFSLSEQLRCKMRVIDALDSDWVIHLDADEVMHSGVEGETLKEALERLDAVGWNAVNFDEFVFLPVENDYVPEAHADQPLLHYYFFQPFSPRLNRAWKKASNFSPLEHGGHLLTGSDLRLSPESLVLRHYMFRNQEHAFHKYANRKFSADDIARGWHLNRVNQSVEAFRFPPVGLLQKLRSAGDRRFDRSHPWQTHYWGASTTGEGPG